jgi:heme/copper-type cytochrome/quinol oxidase subunit 2
MPIVIEAVSKEEFAAWVEGAKEKYSKLGSGAGLAASN